MAIATPNTSARSRKHPRLARPQLALVIGQVRFPALFRIADREFVGPFQEAIRAPYPVVGEQHEIQMVLGPNGVQQLPGQKQWRFQSASGDWAVLLSDGAVTVETRSYEDFDDFLSRFSFVLDALLALTGPTFVDRLGLRYINEFRQGQATSATAWKGLIDSSFLGPLDSKLGQRYSPVRTIQDITLNQGPNEFLSLKHGFIPEGTTVQTLAMGRDQVPVQPVTGPFYLLDLDHFYVRREAFEVAYIGSSLERFHAAIYDIFRLAMTDELYRRLEPAGG
jgi:uncharacterized protein (TIGR04255 family)